MAKNVNVPVKLLQDILEEAQTGLKNNKHTISTIQNSNVKLVAKRSHKAIKKAGGGAAAISLALAGGGAVAAGGAALVGGAAVAGGAAFAGGGAATAVAANAVMMAKAAAFAGGAAAGGAAAGGGAAGALAILGGPVGWAIAGGAIIITLVVAKVNSDKNKKDLQIFKKELEREAILKQNAIIKQHEKEINELERIYNDINISAEKKNIIIRALEERIDYLESMIASTGAVIKICEA